MKNTIIKGKNFWISYNPNTDCGKETALCQDKNPQYLILLGDYKKDYEELIPKGYKACSAKFNELLSNGAIKSKWSD